MDFKTVDYSLWFLAKEGGIHELIRETKRNVLTNYALSNGAPFKGKAMAEKALTMMDYADTAMMHAGYKSKRNEVEINRLHGEQIRLVHNECQQDIESRWNQPVMSDEAFDKALFEDAIAEELEELAQRFGNQEFTISLFPNYRSAI